MTGYACQARPTKRKQRSPAPARPNPRRLKSRRPARRPPKPPPALRRFPKPPRSVHLRRVCARSGRPGSGTAPRRTPSLHIKLHMYCIYFCHYCILVGKAGPDRASPHATRSGARLGHLPGRPAGPDRGARIRPAARQSGCLMTVEEGPLVHPDRGALGDPRRG